MWFGTFTLASAASRGFRYGPAVSRDVALTMGQVPYEFQADWPTFIFQPAAPDMLWHIYSGSAA